ncbi:threonyl-tRNA synthetase editing domain-containing protein [Candidatus Bipolaricaulota bacterium]|nr:threonyl-tRNA synthetase editing domain-containing protein [Candidatus Bipolaricaulota bacterium]
MKLLLVYAERFGYRTTLKTVETAPDKDESVEIEDALVGFIHFEAADEQDPAGMETKLVKNLKWAARKNETKRIILHSFAHLSDTKASPEFAARVLAGAETRLKDAGYEAFQTPFGYFLDLELSAPGRPSARVFKSF